MDIPRRPRQWLTAYWPAKLAGLALFLFILWFAAAYPRGFVEAKFDVARGHYYVKTAGYPARWRHLAQEKLRDRYGIELRAEAGCETTPWLEWYMDGYNRVSERAIRDKFGNVVDQCFEEARVEYYASHPQ